MDIERKSQAARRRRRQILILTVVLAGVMAVTVGLSRLQPAAPVVPRNAVWVDTVKRGAMLRAVGGPGTLVPVEIKWIPTQTAGRVERISILPGAAVTPDTVLVELANPEVEQASLEANWQAKAAEAEMENVRVQLESERLTQDAAAASLRFEQTQAELEAQADEELAKLGLVPQLVAKRSRAKADELKERYQLQNRRIEISVNAAHAQVAVQQAKLEQLRAQAQLKRTQVESLKVRAGLAGVLQKLGDKEPLQVGQQLTPGANVARVADPLRLKAEIKIPETQARDVQLGQTAAVDTRNGVAKGRVQRIDPAVQNGTVTVDVMLEGDLPKGSRPDLTVEGTIELERLENVLNVGRPVQGEAETTAQLFKLTDSGREAQRVNVKLGRTSVHTVEVREGLQEGDQVILSDMSQWVGHTRVRLD
jgi:HlyD family secretion protein